jgi:hypothetical protein
MIYTHFPQQNGQEIEAITGQLTSGTIRHVEGFGLSGCGVECQANRDAEAATGPAWKRHTHDAQDKVQAPQRDILVGMSQRRCGNGRHPRYAYPTHTVVAMFDQIAGEVLVAGAY